MPALGAKIITCDLFHISMWLVAFGGNQALTVCPVLWLLCLLSTAGETLTLRRRSRRQGFYTIRMKVGLVQGEKVNDGSKRMKVSWVVSSVYNYYTFHHKQQTNLANIGHGVEMNFLVYATVTDRGVKYPSTRWQQIAINLKRKKRKTPSCYCFVQDIFVQVFL